MSSAARSRIASVLAVLGMVALGLFYVGVTAVIVPAPWFYMFWLAWLVLLVLTIVLASRQPTRALAVPLASAVFIAAALAVGLAMLGWSG